MALNLHLRTKVLMRLIPAVTDFVSCHRADDDSILPERAFQDCPIGEPEAPVRPLA